MKKEVVLAIAIGFALGLVITFGIWTANKSLATINANSPTPTTTMAPTTPGTSPAVIPTSAPASSGLTISEPVDELLTNKNSVTVTGHASANATVAIISENNKQQVVVADASGNFTASVDLIAGYNTIDITAIDVNGNETNQTLTVTYSTSI